MNLDGLIAEHSALWTETETEPTALLVRLQKTVTADVKYCDPGATTSAIWRPTTGDRSLHRVLRRAAHADLRARR